MAAFFCLVTLALISVSMGEQSKSSLDKKDDNYTVTEEAWFDIEIKDFEEEGDDFRGRFTIALFGETCPMTVLNFKSLVKGHQKGKKTLTYKKSPIHRIVTDFIVQMGDITTGDGTGGESIFGPTFVDENHVISHKATGYVSMANHGPDSNGSQFFITLNRARWLDGKHVAFGKIVKGMDVLRKLGEVPANKLTAVPKKPVKIIDCGIEAVEKYTLTEGESISNDDI